MLRRFGRGLLWGALAYVAGAAATYGLTKVLSSNTHDRELEALMTAFFVVGPAAGVLGFLAGLLLRRA
jgi:F0F1-type ATP synthase membrane subunit c/vacuolar-type H+-ATPase subunit K